jgi:glycine betaine/choline ABC-type transport system substrate-binding protein
MKKVFIIFAFLLAVSPLQTRACVNLDINVGAVDSPRGHIYAALLSSFIHERTGTKSIIKFYPNLEDMRNSAADQKVELIIVNIADALRLADLPFGRDAQADFNQVKKIYKKDISLILMSPLAPINGQSHSDELSAPALSPKVLEKFPALPRLLKKLSGKVDAKVTARLLEEVRNGGKKPARAAKDFLEANHLI